ncbi:hypothetical protein GZ77_24315 [Endozoicomonas montiporae]|uniref:Uncharacterized protein n=2 Tax=Endozoicomonas montiporae TaxID=1027273 RepID=A0A081MZM2_9GAMM|nr:DUF3392 family protein [Endozoicomonas montiporae]AMO54669.1 hypothetical protein EZMO1_0417 [Endozoicomonas montiporae CL-33]KEQ11645.1 hypothetical protein GZ77_24315 [Endozoicomonas montiporae]
MDGIAQIIIAVSQFCRNNLTLIAIALTAVAVVFGGKALSALSCSWTSRMHGVLRIPVRAVFNLALFGAIFSFVPYWVASLLAYFNNYTLAPVLLVLFILVGLASDRYAR